MSAPSLTACLGLGSNLGDRMEILRRAICDLGADPRFVVLHRAGVYRTRPVGPDAGEEFLNTAVIGLWAADGETLLEWCQATEHAHDRRRPYANAPRTLDIDILWWDAPAVATERIEIPHARLGERAFALVPLLELAPDLVWPTDGTSLSSGLTPRLLEQGIEAFLPAPTTTVIRHD